MPNTVHGPFVPITVTNGLTPANSTWGTNAQTQADAALNGFNGDLLTPFVLSGCVCTMDAGNHKQLDVTAGRVYIKMTDATIGLIATIASVTNQFLTSTPSTTYYLDINPDGTWSFATSHSGVTNHLTICSLTTDGSGNINVITDARTLNTTLLASALGALSLPTTFTSTNGAGSGFAWTPALSGTPFLLPLDINPTGGTSPTHWAIGYNGADGHLQIQQVTSNIDVIDIDTSGNVFFAKQISGVGNQTTAGALGVPVVVAQANRVAVTATTDQTFLTYTATATGWYRASLYFSYRNGTPQKVVARAGWYDIDLSTIVTAGYFILASGPGLGEVLNGSQAIAMGNNQGCASLPIVFYAATGQAMALHFQDGGGTPNDVVSGMFERLS